jgi:hypothetical protein
MAETKQQPESKVLEMPKAQPAPSHFKVTALVDGFYTALEFDGDVHRLRAVIDGLKKIGATPTAPPANKPGATQAAPAGPPRCNLHNKQMKASRKPGSWFCPARLADGSYCDQKVEAE